MAKLSSSKSLEARVPKLRFPGFEGEWEETLFTDLFSFLGNNTLSRAELTDTGKVKNIHYGDILIRFSDVTNIVDSIIPYIKNNELLKKKTDYLQTGDVIIADTAEDDSVGKATEIFNPNNTPIVAGLHTIPCRPIFPFTPSYLGYYINSKAFHSQLYPYMQGVKVTSISKGNIGRTMISYPNLSEQCKIANLLNILSERIEKQRQLVEALKLYKRGVLCKLFSSIKSKVPLYTISKYCSSSNTMATIKSSRNGSYPVYDAGGIVTYINKFEFGGPYVAIIKDGSGVGRLQLCQSNSSVIGTLGAIFPINCTVDYLYSALQTVDFRQFTTGMAIPHIYYKDYKNVLVPFPTKQKQHCIESVSSKLNIALKQQEKLLNLLDIQKKSLLQQLFI